MKRAAAVPVAAAPGWKVERGLFVPDYEPEGPVFAIKVEGFAPAPAAGKAEGKSK